MENTNVPQGEWFTNEWGSQRFHHEGWEIVIPEERNRLHAPYITCPFNDCQVDITDEGLMVFGEECGADYAGYSGVHDPVDHRDGRRKGIRNLERAVQSSLLKWYTETMEIIKVNRPHESYTLYVTPKDRVEIHTHNRSGELVNVKVFREGDFAEYDSYNLRYTAPIKSITAKNVIFDTGSKFRRDETKRLKMESFAWRNHDFDAAEVAAQNAETSLYI